MGMSHIKSKNRSRKATKGKNDRLNASGLQAVETKKRIRWAQFWGVLAALLFWASQILDSHRLPFPTLLLEIGALSTSAGALWLGFVHESGKHRLATTLVCLYLLVGCVICAALYWNPSRPTRDFAAEVDDAFRGVFLAMRLKQITEFEDLRPLSACLRVQKRLPGEIRSFTFKFKDALPRPFLFSPQLQDPFKALPIPAMLSNEATSNALYDTTLEVDSTNAQNLQYAFDQNRIGMICLLIPISDMKRNPFKTVRDLNGALLSFSASQKLRDRLESIEFIVNGWGLFYTDVRQSHWQPNEDGYQLLCTPGSSTTPPLTAFPLTLHTRQFAFHQKLSEANPMTEGEVFQQVSYQDWQPDDRKRAQRARTSLLQASKAVLKLKPTIRDIDPVDPDRRYPGFAWAALLRLMEPTVTRTNYIMDFGESSQSSRFSLYLDPQRRLCFRLVDDAGRVQTADVSAGATGFAFGQIFAFGCDFGSGPDFSFLRLFVNGELVGKQILTPRRKVRFERPDLVVGGNLSGTNGGVVEVSEVMLWQVSLNKATIRETFDVMNAHLKANRPRLTFNGGGFWKAPHIMGWETKP
jgi:hypothetical protein